MVLHERHRKNNDDNDNNRKGITDSHLWLRNRNIREIYYFTIIADAI